MLFISAIRVRTVHAEPWFEEESYTLRRIKNDTTKTSPGPSSPLIHVGSMYLLTPTHSADFRCSRTDVTSWPCSRNYECERRRILQNWSPERRNKWQWSFSSPEFHVRTANKDNFCLKVPGICRLRARSCFSHQIIKGKLA